MSLIRTSFESPLPLLAGLTVFGYFALLLVYPPANQAAFLCLLVLTAVAAWRLGPALPLPRLEYWLLVSFGLFFAIALLTYLAGPMNDDGLAKMGKFLRLPLALLLLLALPRFDLRTWIWAGCVAGSLSAFGYAFDQVVINGAPRAGPPTNPILFGDLALMLGFWSVSLIQGLTGIRRWNVALGLLALGAALVASFLSGTRGAWLAIPILLWILYLQYRGSVSFRLKLVAALLLVVTTIAAFTVEKSPLAVRAKLLIENAQTWLAEDQSLPGAEKHFSSVGSRLDMWAAALRVAQEKPVLGLRWEGLSRTFDEAVELHGAHPTVAVFGHAHNQYLESLANGGVLGLLAFLLTLAAPGVIFFRARRLAGCSAAAWSGLLLVVGYAVFAITEAVYVRVLPVSFFALGTVLMVAQIRWADHRVTSD